MSIKSYQYSGPPSGVSLDTGQDVLLFNGKTYKLPEDNGYVKVMVKLKHLKEVHPASKNAPVERPPVKSESKPKKEK